MVGNSVSHANNKTKRKQRPNLKVKKVFLKELGRSVRIRMSTKALKSLKRMDLKVLLKKRNLSYKDIL